MNSSKMLISIADILKQEGFISDYSVEEVESNNILTVTLKYSLTGIPAITDLIRVSKPGIRKYRGYKEIKTVRNGMGISILSTPNGVITGKDAITQKVGGEYLCDIW
jgi:small subunit ribosomal protein S8